jgi:hypothetical protein
MLIIVQGSEKLFTDLENHQRKYTESSDKIFLTFKIIIHLVTLSL